MYVHNDDNVRLCGQTCVSITTAHETRSRKRRAPTDTIRARACSTYIGRGERGEGRVQRGEGRGERGKIEGRGERRKEKGKVGDGRGERREKLRVRFWFSDRRRQMLAAHLPVGKVEEGGAFQSLLQQQLLELSLAVEQHDNREEQ
jgi:hypothetical protein